MPQKYKHESGAQYRKFKQQKEGIEIEGRQTLLDVGFKEKTCGDPPKASHSGSYVINYHDMFLIRINRPNMMKCQMSY